MDRPTPNPDVLDHLHEARRLDAQERRDREQRWTLPTTAEGWRELARLFATRVCERRCIGVLRNGEPCFACRARVLTRTNAKRVLDDLPHSDLPEYRREAHLRAPCLDHDALVCPDPHCTGAIGDGSHDGAPPTCDSCGITWGRCVDCEAVHDHERACPGCAAQEAS